MAIRTSFRSHHFCPVYRNLIWNTAADVQTATKCFKGFCCEHRISNLCRGVGKTLKDRWLVEALMAQLRVSSTLAQCVGCFRLLRSMDFGPTPSMDVWPRRLSHLWPFPKLSSFRSHGSTKYWMKAKHGKYEAT